MMTTMVLFFGTFFINSYFTFTNRLLPDPHHHHHTMTTQHHTTTTTMGCHIMGHDDNDDGERWQWMTGSDDASCIVWTYGMFFFLWYVFFALLHFYPLWTWHCFPVMVRFLGRMTRVVWITGRKSTSIVIFQSNLKLVAKWNIQFKLKLTNSSQQIWIDIIFPSQQPSTDMDRYWLLKWRKICLHLCTPLLSSFFLPFLSVILLTYFLLLSMMSMFNSSLSDLSSDNILRSLISADGSLESLSTSINHGGNFLLPFHLVVICSTQWNTFIPSLYTIFCWYFTAKHGLQYANPLSDPSKCISCWSCILQKCCISKNMDYKH